MAYLCYRNLSDNDMPEMKKIFLTDDDLDDIEFLQSAISIICKDYTITVMHNGEELLAQLKKDKTSLPDIIFLDINMPKIDGLEALKRIRSSAKHKSIPIVLYSTSSNDLNIKAAYSLGANFYFVKPSSYQSLTSNLKKFLSINWEKYSFPVKLSEFVCL